MEEIVVIPVDGSIYLDDRELIGDIVTYKEVPKYFLEDEGDL